MGRENRQTLVTSAIVAVMLLAATSGVGIVAGSSHAPGVESADFEGDGVVTVDDDGVTELWNDGNYTLDLSVTSPAGAYRVCTKGPDSADADCRHVTFENGTNAVAVNSFPWTENATGTRHVTVTIKNPGTPETYDSVEREVDLLDPDTDPDNDGLANRAEVRWGTNMTVPDTDRDGLEDGAEVTTYGTNPLTNDTDDDGLRDATEVDGKTDPTLADTDGDGLSDYREVEELDTDPTEPDTDGDGLSDYREVEILGTDPTEADTDEDGFDDGKEVGNTTMNATNSNVPSNSFEDDVETMLPTSIGHSLFLLGFVAVLGGGIAIGLSVMRGVSVRDRLPGGDVDAGEKPVGSSPEPDSTPPSPMGGEASAESGDARGGPNRGPGPAPHSESGPTPQSEPDPEQDAGPTPAPILTDEERVLEILGDNGGQVKQQRIVNDTDWSKSKVSRLLSEMADDGTVRKITLGRENVIRLPEDDGSGPSGPADGE